MSFSGHGFILMITSTAGKGDHLYAKIIVYICIRLRCFLLSSKLSRVRQIVFIIATNRVCGSFLYRPYCSFNVLDEV